MMPQAFSTGPQGTVLSSLQSFMRSNKSENSHPQRRTEQRFPQRLTEDAQSVNGDIFVSQALFIFGSGLLNSTETTFLVTTTVSK